MSRAGCLFTPVKMACPSPEFILVIFLYAGPASQEGLDINYYLEYKFNWQNSRHEKKQFIFIDYPGHILFYGINRSIEENRGMENAF
jgi:hypothetical protein